MKTKFLQRLFPFLLAAVPGWIQQASAQTHIFNQKMTGIVCDSTVTYKWQNDDWQPGSSEIRSIDKYTAYLSSFRERNSLGESTYLAEYTRDSAGRTRQADIYMDMGAGLAKYGMAEFSYNAKGYLATEIDKVWNSATQQYENGLKYEYDYDASNFLTSKEVFTYKNGNWAKQTLEDITNNNSGVPTEILGLIWDDNSGMWYYVKRTTNTVSTANQITESVIETSAPDFAPDWKNSMRTTYAYDSQNKQASSLLELWNDNTSLWEKNAADSVLAEGTVHYVYQNDSWAKSTLVTCGGEADLSQPAAPISLGATATKLPGERMAIDLAWTDNATNENGFIVYRSIDNFFWDAIDSLPEGTTSYQDTGLKVTTKYYYKISCYNTGGESGFSNVATATTLAGIAGNNMPKVWSVYPNPAHGLVSLQANGKAEAATVNIMNMLGETVYITSLHENSLSMDISSLPAGMYILHITSAWGNWQQQLLVK